MSMSVNLAETLGEIRGRMDAACRRAGRDPAEVRLLPVTKTLGPDIIGEAAAAGLSVFGENRVQEARQKIPLCASGLKWHLVGHLQTNKAREAVRLFEMIHSVDSVKLLEFLDRVCQEEGRSMPVCIEVNVSGERSKFGMAPAEVPALLARASSLFRVRIEGLMTIPPVAEDAEESRVFFRRLRELRDGWRRESGLDLPELSMGMSHDFEIAVEEGATWVRIGTLLFGGRKKAERAEPHET
jgi:pyridoxal phosphate enzyme (YggS family)